MQAKQPAKAIARIQAQIAKSPGNAGFYVQLAHVQYATQDYKASLESARKAMQLDPSAAEPEHWFVQNEIALGASDTALSTQQNWVNSHPNDGQGYQILGSINEAKGNVPAAMDAYKKTLQLDPNDIVASNNLAYLMVENGQNVDVALTLAQTARRNAPDSPDTADTLAWVYYYKHNYGAARDLLESTLQASPDNALLQFHLGMVYSKLNDKADAQQHLKKAAALAPNSKIGKDASTALAQLG
jgi:tetratricopeptide (TPR) repeat protein